MSHKVEAIPDSYAELGEGPHWDIQTQSLYYVDITGGRLLRYDYLQNKMYSCKVEGESLASFVVPIEGSTTKFAVGCARRVVIVDWDGLSETCKVERTLFEVQTGEKFAGNRFNDGKCDPLGRLFAGTMRYVGDEFAQRDGELYKYEKGGRLELVKTDVGISNGLAWNERKKKFYFIDTTDYEVKEYDYDFAKGIATNPRKAFYFSRNINDPPETHLLLDGMTIDSDGNLYVATYNGYTVYQVDPDSNKVLLEIKLPCKQITSVAFGGPKLDILFVTTSARPNEPSPAGTTFKVTGLGSSGLPMTKLRL